MVTRSSQNQFLAGVVALLAFVALAGCFGSSPSASSVASSGCADTTFTPTSSLFTVLMVNDSDVLDTAVYLLLTGNPLSGVSSNIASLNVQSGNPPSNVVGTLLSSLTPVGTLSSPYTGKCRTVYAFSLQSITGGRLLVSYSTPVTYYATGAPTNTSENYRWDKLELAYTGSDASAGADLTSLDFFGIPMQIDFLDGNGQSSASTTFYTSTTTLLNTLYNLSSSTMSGAFQQVGSGGPTSGWAPADGLTNFARVLAPQSLTAINSGYPAPYPSFKIYLDSLVSSGQTINVAGANGVSGNNPTGYNYTGTLSGNSTTGYTVTFTGALTTSGTNPNNNLPYGPPYGVCSDQSVQLLTYSATPTVTVSLPAPGSVTGVSIAQAGSGYTSAPAVTFSAPPPGGTTAQGTATVSPAGIVTGVAVTNTGSGYTSAPAVTIAPPPPGGTTALVTATINGFDDYIYGASANAFTVANITSPTVNQYPDQCTKNSVFANIAGDFIAGLNFGYLQNVNSGTAKYPAGTWYSNPPIPYPFGGATTINAGYYNPYAAVLYNLSDAYGFAFSDRSGRPSPLVGTKPSQATMRVMFLNDNRLDAPQPTVTARNNNSITLSWPAVAGASGYSVMVSPPYPESTTSNVTVPYTIAGLTPGTNYTISVTANGVQNGRNVRSAAIPLYATTTGGTQPLTGPIQFQTALNWGVSSNPAGLTFQIDGQPYTPGGANVTVNGNSGTNVYPLTISDGSGPIFQGNYIVTLNGSGSSYTVNPNGPFLLTQNPTALTQAGPPGTPPYGANQLVVGTPFAPTATKQIFSVCFPATYSPAPPPC